MSPTARTQLHMLLQLGPISTCVWRRSRGWSQGWSSGGGSRTACTWRGFRRRLGKHNGQREMWAYMKKRDGDGLNQWKDNVSNKFLGKDPNATPDYYLGLELHHPIMSTLRGQTSL